MKAIQKIEIKVSIANTLLIKGVTLTLLPFLYIVFPYDLACSVEFFKILKQKLSMPPATNDHSTSDSNDEKT